VKLGTSNGGAPKVKIENKQYFNTKTIKYISNQDPIEILPAEIIFKDI